MKFKKNLQSSFNILTTFFWQFLLHFISPLLLAIGNPQNHLIFLFLNFYFWRNSTSQKTAGVNGGFCIP